MIFLNMLTEKEWCVLHCLWHAKITDKAGPIASIFGSLLWECLESIFLDLEMSEHVMDFLYCDRMGDMAPQGNLVGTFVHCCRAAGFASGLDFLISVTDKIKAAKEQENNEGEQEHSERSILAPSTNTVGGWA
jgi:hypothetical protein